MPLVRIDLPKGKGAEVRGAISRGVQAALVEIFNVPADDLFQVITEHEAGIGLVRPKSYLGIEYSDDLVLIQLTVSDTRGIEQKKQLFKRIAERLSDNPGLRPQDVLINLVEVKKENWSFGNGTAQYA
jgi:phenylpyruvate tautomerase PptA (4-oxalocrotonate tautomerase family)